MNDPQPLPPLVPLPGSERPAAPAAAQRATSGADSAAAAMAGTIVQATLVLRRRGPLPTGGAPMTPAELAGQAGADPDDVELVRTTLAPFDVEVVDADAPSRRIRVQGTVDALQRAFGTELTMAAAPEVDGTAPGRRRTGGLSVPRPLDGVVTAVLGLDDRPQARTRFRVAAAATPSAAFTPLQLGELYAFPAGTDGAGTTVAIVELGGGYRQADLDTYFAALGVGAPAVVAVAVDGAANAPTGAGDGPDGEVMLDIEVVGALAPRAAIPVYFAPNTDDGFLDAVAEATHASPTPAAISISWGQSEEAWTAQSRRAFDDALADATALGIVITVAAGDDGSTDNQQDGRPHVDFPAASPHALACGGTSLTAMGGAIESETVWNDGGGRGATGGGVSRFFPLPDWQAGAGVPALAASAGGRGVPDVAADADPATGYRVRIDGTDTVIGGTSAVAPLWAALVARLVQSLGHPIGPLQPKVYPLTDGFHDITVGTNGAYSAAAGWDACTGLGSPDGTALLAALRA